MGAELLVGLALSAASAGMNAYNTNKTINKQDKALATDIRNQGIKRREGEALTNAEIQKLSASTSADERKKKLSSYTDAIRRKSGEATNGLLNGVGGDTFQADASSAAGDVLAYGNENADLMSRIDAPIDQRIGEANSFGNLGINLDTVAREAQGRHFLDQLRVNSIRRNPWMDAGSQVLNGLGGSMIGGGAVSGGATSGAPSLSAYTGAMKNSGASGFGFGNMANAGKIVGLPPR